MDVVLPPESANVALLHSDAERLSPPWHISEQGRSFIAAFEGLRLAAYADSAGVWTIGIGHVRNVRPGMKITLEEAYRFFAEDIAPVEQTLSSSVVCPLAQHEVDALCSFIFNLGSGAFRRSALLRCLNRGDRDAASDQFLRWNKARDVRTGKLREVPGLTRRRQCERLLFRTGVYSTDIQVPKKG